MQRLRLVGWICLGFLLATLPALAQQPSPLGLEPTPVVEPLSVQLWMDKGSYTEGETARITFSVNQSAYVYIFNIQSDGIVRLIFPNAYSQNNFVSPGIHTLPDGLYEFLMTPPAGTDHLQIIASLAPLQLPAATPSEPYPILGTDPNAARSIIEAQTQGISTEPLCTPLWTTAWCSFTIVAASHPSCWCQPPTTYIPPTSLPTTYTPPSYTPPTCTLPTYPLPSYGYSCPPVTTYCPPSPCLFPFFGGTFRIRFGFRIGIGCCDND